MRSQSWNFPFKNTERVIVPGIYVKGIRSTNKVFCDFGAFRKVLSFDMDDRFLDSWSGAQTTKVVCGGSGPTCLVAIGTIKRVSVLKGKWTKLG